MSEIGGGGVPQVGAYPSPPYPDKRPPAPPNGLKAPDDGPGVRRNKRRAAWTLAVVVLVVVAAGAAFLAGGGEATRAATGLSLATGAGGVLPPTSQQGWTLRHRQGSETYVLTGLRPGDTFTSVMNVTNIGDQPEAVSTVTSDDGVGTIDGIRPAYAPVDAARSDGPFPATATLPPGDTVTAALQWRVAGCSDAGTGSTVLLRVTMSWSDADLSIATPMTLPYAIRLVDAPVCS